MFYFLIYLLPHVSSILENEFMDADATKKDKGDYIIGAPPFRNRDQVQMLFNFPL